MGLPEGQVIEQAYVILLKLDKNKEVPVSNDWGKIGKKTQRNFVGSKLLLNMTLPLRVRVGLGCFIHQSHHHGLTIPSIFGVMLPIHRISVAICSREVVQKESTRSHPLPYIILHPSMTPTLNHMS